MSRLWALIAVFCLCAGGLSAREKAKPSPRWAPTWEDAVETAQALNAPIVVHRHGFYWGPCWTMHRSVLQNQGYIKYAAKNTVEVISMEEMDKALQQKHPATKTYVAKDRYGDRAEYLVEFGGLTVDELEDLSNGKAIEYMRGGRIPYTAIVDPHTLKELEGVKGTKSASQLIAIIKPHVKALKKIYGPGIARKTWDEVVAGQIEIDKLLGERNIKKAVAVYRLIAQRAVSRKDALAKNVESTRLVLVEELEKRVKEFETSDARDPKVARELAGLARSVGAPELEKRLAPVKKDTEK